MRWIFGLAILAVICIGTSANEKNHLLIAPQIIREGVLETVVLNLHGISGTVNVVAWLKLDGLNKIRFNNVNARKPILMKIQYNKRNAQPTNRRKYVELNVTVTRGEVKFYTGHLKMRLIENSGYLYVQTDRPIYRPEELVKYRVIALNQQQLPERAREIEIVIRIPQENVGVEKKKLRMSNVNGFVASTYQLPEYPVYGIWSVQARYSDQKEIKWATRKFEVRPYVLPTFNVAIKVDKSYILVKDDMSEEVITGELTAEYSYGKKVSGLFYIVGKLKRPGFEKAVMFYQYPSEVNIIESIKNGRKRFTIKATEVLKVLDDDEGFATLVEEGATITIEASVTGRVEGTIETDISRPLVFRGSPYKIDISRMSRYYTPGTLFEIKVDVIDSVTGSPIPGVDVVVTGPTSCGDLTCPENRCCKDKKCAMCTEVKVATDANGQVNRKINMGSDKVKRTYTFVTKDFNVPDENEPKVTVTLHPYNSRSNSYLVLSAAGKIATVGDVAFQIDVRFKTAPTELQYLILTRGSILSAGNHEPQKGSTQTTMNLEITGEMVPSFRLFVYYKHGDEIVSNSLWVDVKDACKKEIEVSVPGQVLPGEIFNMKYKGSSGALIGISAVDRAAYFLYGDSRLTRQSAFEELNQYDEACVREGGKNAQHVFEEGGLQLVGGNYEMKDDFNNHCDEGKLSRKKRASDKKIARMADKFEKEAEIRKCKIDGKMASLAQENCEQRAKRVEDLSHECAQEFKESCMLEARMSKIAKSSAISSGSNAAASNTALATTRSNFEESMVWRTAMLGPDGTLNVKTTAGHSITTFEFDTVSMHNTDGFCVAKTQNMTIFKDVFIQLKLPYSLKRREQAEVKAMVFNYGRSSQTVRLEVKMGMNICSHFPEEEFSEVATLVVNSNSAVSTSFVLLPLHIPKNEKVEIELKAYDLQNYILDHIRKGILVQPEGEVNDVKGTHAIDLKNKPDGHVERFTMKFAFPENTTPGSRKCWLYSFSNFMGPVIEFDPVTKQPKNDIRKIIRMPGGCGEQTMLSMGPNVYAHKYLIAVDKMKRGSAEEKGSIDKMKSGFANQLKYRCNCDPKVWSVFPNHAPSVWLNAYVNKVFAQAKQFDITMDVTPICTSVKWLTAQQDSNGSFKSGARVIHQEMHGAVGSKLSLTAYVMMSLVESRAVCPDLVNTAQTAIVKAQNFLHNSEDDAQMEQPYALALVSYAMSLWKPLDSFAIRVRAKLRNKMQKSEDNRLAFWQGAPLHQIEGTGTHAYWYRRKPLAIDIEATGYAMMSILLASKADGEFSQDTLDLTRKIVLWLIEQRDENGGFTTTQDTVVGLQALSEYMIWSNLAEPSPKDVKIDLTLGLPENPIRLHLDKRNESFSIPIQLSSSVVGAGELNVEARGEGEGTLSYRCIYRTLVSEDSCHYDLQVTTEEYFKTIDPKAAKERPQLLKVNLVLSKPKGDPSGQSIIEINLISGYEADEPSLQQLSTLYVDGILERYETANQKVIMYLKEITDVPIRLAFLLQRTVEVRKPEPASVTVYDYYEPSVKCSQFYALPKKLARLRTTRCENEEGMGGENICKCAEGGCLKCRTRSQQLQNTACHPNLKGDCEICKNHPENCYNMVEMACKGNYVYEVTIVKDVEDDTSLFVQFDASITKVYKAGPDPTALQQVRKFVSRKDCFENCKDDDLAVDRNGKMDATMLRKDRKFLIIGFLSEKNTDKNGISRTVYSLEENEIVERIYPDSKCKKALLKTESQKCKKTKQTQKQKESCAKSRAISQLCKNMDQLRRKLITGCD